MCEFRDRVNCPVVAPNRTGFTPGDLNPVPLIKGYKRQQGKNLANYVSMCETLYQITKGPVEQNPNINFVYVTQAQSAMSIENPGNNNSF